MKRRNFLRGLLAAPMIAAAGPLLANLPVVIPARVATKAKNTGARIEGLNGDKCIKVYDGDKCIKVYDENNVLRVQFGVWE